MNIPYLLRPCMIQHVRLSASFCALASTWLKLQCESMQGRQTDYAKPVSSGIIENVWALWKLGHADPRMVPS